MKKIGIIITVLLLVTITCLFLFYKDSIKGPELSKKEFKTIVDNLPSNPKQYLVKEVKFIKIQKGEFYLKDSLYFPMMLNYIINFREMDNQLVISPNRSYDSLNKFDASTPKEVAERLNAHFQLVKEMGFNTIRLVGLDRCIFDKKKEKLIYSYGAYDKNNKPTTIPILKNKKAILNATAKVIQIAKKHQLHVMILLPQIRKSHLANKQRIKFIASILHRFSNNPTVFSYDFFNEPLYFDNDPVEFNHVKKRKYKLISHWKELMNTLAPNQLFTIGFSEPIEVFRWDPSVLPIDFISFHTYNPLRVPNEIYWYSHYTNKPWMIGETSLPADNDSISYLLQKQFMKEALKRTMDCGGIGFGWWQFQDEPNVGEFEAKYTPLLNHQGITHTKKGNYVIYGSVKPAGRVIKKILKNYTPTNNCDCKTNYYNMLGYTNYLLKGKVVNKKTGKPIEGAVIRGWNENWSVGLNTFTNKEGVFTLFSNDKCVHFEISAPGMKTIKFENHFQYTPKNDTVNPKEIKIKNKKLEYQDIDFRKYLKYKDQLKDSSLYKKHQNIIFRFKKELFHKYKLKSNMGTKELKPLNFN